MKDHRAVSFCYFKLLSNSFKTSLSGIYIQGEVKLKIASLDHRRGAEYGLSRVSQCDVRLPI